MPERSTRTAYRIAGFYAVSFALVSLLLGAAIGTFASRTLRQALDDRLRAELSTLLGADRREGRDALIADIAARDSVFGSGGYLLADSRGRRVAGKVAIPTPAPGMSDVEIRSPGGGGGPGRAAAVVMPTGETLAVVSESGSLVRIERTLLAISGAGLAVMIAIGVGGGFWIGHSIHRRLSAVDLAAAAIIDGDLSRRMPIGPRGDEYDRLSVTLNRMLDHIGQLMDSLRHVSDDIAHDLRTPLARLRLQLEVAAAVSHEAASRSSLVEAVARVDGIMDVFSTILRISEVERGTVRRHFVPVRIDLLATEIAEEFAQIMSDGGQVIVSEIQPAVVVQGDEGLLGQVIVNLLENAIKHTPPNSIIRIGVSRHGDGSPLLSVTDDGPGVPPEERADVLRRFGRREASRSTPGNGLGLTLVAAIATTHRAELLLGDAAPGLSVTLLFPRQLESL